MPEEPKLTKQYDLPDTELSDVSGSPAEEVGGDLDHMVAVLTYAYVREKRPMVSVKQYTSLHDCVRFIKRNQLNVYYNQVKIFTVDRSGLWPVDLMALEHRLKLMTMTEARRK